MATFAEPDRSRKRDPLARDDRKTSTAQGRSPSIGNASPQQEALRHLAVTLNSGPRAIAHRRLAQMIQPGSRVVQGVFLDTAKIGLELTFENDQTAEYFINDGIPSGKIELAKTWWNDTQKEWSAATNAPATDGYEDVNIETKKASNKDFGGHTGELDNTILEYRLTPESEEPDWWWRLSVDPGVVEIQTAPVSASQLADTNPRAAAPAAAAAGVVPPAAAGGAPPALAGAGGPPVAGGLVAPAAAGVAAPAAAGVAAPAAAGVVPLTAAAAARAARARRAAARAHASALGPRYTPNDIGKIINQHIYGGAANLRPPLSPGGGGGHINVDFATGFARDYGLVIKVLRRTEELIKLNRGRDLTAEQAELIDVGNEGSDPFVATNRTWRRTKSGPGGFLTYNPKLEVAPEADRFGDWKAKVYPGGEAAGTNPGRFEKFRREHAAWLFEHPSGPQDLDLTAGQSKIGSLLNDNAVRNVLHYQAVNLDHLLEDKEGRRRVEFRFFDAQATLDDIIEGVRLIAQITEQADR